MGMDLLNQIPILNLEDNGRIIIYRGLTKALEPNLTQIDRVTCWTLCYYVAREYALYRDPSTMAGRFIPPNSGCVISASAPTDIPKIRRAMEKRERYALELEKKLRKEGETQGNFLNLFINNSVIWLQPDEYKLLKDIQVVDSYSR